MKVAVLILVLANFAVFAWLHWARPFASPPDTGLEPPATAGAPLRLLAAKSSGGARRCLVVGPAADASAARALADRLRRKGYPARPLARKPARPDSYQVVVTGFADAAAAGKAAARLRAGGIHDLLVGDAGSAGQHGISLGLFGDLAHARRRASRVRALGFAPEIQARYSGARRWSVEVAGPSNATALAAAAATAVKSVACEVPAAASG